MDVWASDIFDWRATEPEMRRRLTDMLARRGVIQRIEFRPPEAYHGGGRCMLACAEISDG